VCLTLVALSLGEVTVQQACIAVRRLTVAHDSLAFAVCNSDGYVTVIVVTVMVVVIRMTVMLTVIVKRSK
jgi:hypothetical protein